MNDLEYALGLDLAPLEASTSKARGILGGFRSEQEKLFSAMDRLTAVQQRAQLERVANYRPEIILQREILGLKQTIANIEGTTTAKLEAQIILTQKQLQLEKMIAAERSKSAVDFSSVASGTAKATERADGLGKSMGRLVSVAGVLKGAFTSLVGIGSSLFAPAIADRLARLVTGFSKAQEAALEKTVELTGKAADEQERALEKLRAAKQRESDESVERSNREYELIRDARDQAREEDLAAERSYRQSLYDIQQSADQAHLQHVQENLELLTLEAKAKRGLTEEEAKRLQVLRDQRSELDRQQQITTLLSLNQRTPEEEAVLQKLIAQSVALKEQLGTEKEIVEVVKKRRKAEEEAARAKWAGSIRVEGRADTELSPRELQRKIDLLEQDIFNREFNLRNNGWIGPGAPYDPLLEMQRPALAGALAEQRRQEDTRRNVSAFGEDRAFAMFGGTETEFLQILRGLTNEEKTVKALEDIGSKLERGLKANAETLKTIRQQ